jgi:flagellin
LSESTAISTTTTLEFTNVESSTPTLIGTTVSSGASVQDLVDAINNTEGVRAEFDESNGELTIYSNQDLLISDTLTTATTANLTIGSAASVNASALTTGSLLTNSGSFAVGDTIALTDGNNYELGSLEIEASTTVSDLVNFINDFNGVDAQYNNTTGRLSITSETDLTVSSERSGSANTDFASTNFAATANGAQSLSALTDSGFATDTEINRVITRLNNSLGNLRTQASEFGTNLSIVENRQDFTRLSSIHLQEGAGKLTLADTNEEGANLLALQTRQQLASTSLSFASQADQTVLSLF